MKFNHAIVLLYSLHCVVDTCRSQSSAWDFSTETCLPRLVKMSKHIMQVPEFWEMFKSEIEQKMTWKCSFNHDVLYEKLEEDSKLYTDDTLLRYRRKNANKWVQNDTLWSNTVLGACREIAYNKPGVYSQELEKYNMLEALKDFVEHIHYFHETKYNMEARGQKVIADAQHDSGIHDIDKLDPVMLVGYSERFEDNKATSLWNLCVDRHVHINPHHQQHCVWHDCCKKFDNVTCNAIGENGLREMVCDKVSRRVQMNLNGKISEDMWNVDEVYYNGLPEPWLRKSNEIMTELKLRGMNSKENSKYCQ